MQIDRYEGMIPSVIQAQNSANRMKAIVNYMRGKKDITNKELENALKEQGVGFSPRFAQLLADADVLDTEVREEEEIMIDCYFSPYLEGFTYKVNPDATVTVTFGWHTNKTVIVYEPLVYPNTWGDAIIEGKRKITVRRRYWSWKE